MATRARGARCGGAERAHACVRTAAVGRRNRRAVARARRRHVVLDVALVDRLVQRALSRRGASLVYVDTRAGPSRNCFGSRPPEFPLRSCAPVRISQELSREERRGLPRTLLTALIPAAAIATAWLRLESPINEPLRSVAVAGLAILPALVRPLAARLVVFVLAAGGSLWVAYDVSPLHPRHLPGAVWSSFSGGFLDFYDVKTPFDPRVHAEMRAVLLTAVFAFAFGAALAIAARRPVPALLVLFAGAGWPATLRGPSGGLVVGVVILLGGLSVLAGLTRRDVPRVVIPAAACLAVAALLASTSSAVAKSGLVSWQHWDFYTATQKPVSVEFVWSSQYRGIHFPRKRTTVLQVKAPRRRSTGAPRCSTTSSATAGPWRRRCAPTRSSRRGTGS